MSEGQKKLLNDSKSQIDWKRVKRIAEIKSTSWTTRTKPPLGKLSLELWEWPSGSILELSMKVAQDAEQVAYRTEASCEREWVGIEHQATLQNSDRIGTDHRRASIVGDMGQSVDRLHTA